MRADKDNMSRVLSAAILSIVFIYTSAYAQSGPSNINITGALFDSTGAAITSPSVNFKIELYDKTGSCLLYSENHLAVDLSQTKGAFSIEIGDGSSIQNLIDATSPTAMSSKVYENPGAIAGGWAGCLSGTTLADSDPRVIRVKYDLGGGYVTMNPDVPLASAAYATVAQTLQGKRPADFIQVHNDVSNKLTQANVENVFSATNYPKLTALLGGSSTDYMSANPSSAVSLNNQRMTNLADPTAAQDAATKNYADSYLGGKSVDVSGVGPATGDGYTLIWDKNAGKWTTGVPAVADNTKLPLAGGTMTGTIDFAAAIGTGINLNGNDLIGTGHITMSPLKTLTLGSFTSAQETTLVGTLTAANAGASWYNTTSNTFKIWNGTTAISQTFTGATAGGDLTGTYPNPTIANDKITSAKVDSAGIGLNRLVISDQTTGANLKFATCGTNEVLRYEGVNGWICRDPSAIVTFPVTKVNGKTGDITLNANDLGLGTAALENVGTGAGDIPQLDAGGKIPSSMIPAASSPTWGDITNAAGKYMTYKPNNTACGNDEILKFDGTNWICADISTLGTGDFKKDGSIAMTGNLQLGGQWLSNDGGSEGLRVDNSGNVGIGTSTTTYNLSLNGQSAQTIGLNRQTASAGQSLTVQAGGAQAGGNNLNGGNLILSSGTTTGNGGSGISFMVAGKGYPGSGSFDHAPQEVMSIGSTGEVYISYTAQNTNSGYNGLTLYNDMNASALTMMHDMGGASLSNGDLVSQIDSWGRDSNNFPLKLAQVRTTIDNVTAASVQSSMALATMVGSTLSDRVTIKGVNVGIGTTAPARLLHVNGPMRLTPAALPTSPAAGELAFDSGAANALKFYDGAAWQTVGTGTGSGDFKKDGSVAMTGNFNAGGNSILGNTTASANLTLESTSDATKGYVNIQPNGGNVGIGTTAPIAKLQVTSSIPGTAGGYNLAANDRLAGIFESSPTAGGTNYLVLNNTTAPTTTKGNAILFASQKTGEFILGNDLDGSGAQNFSLIDLPTGDTRLMVDAVGNVGIGTTTPTRLLDVNGPMRIAPAALPTSPAAGELAFDSGAANALKFYDGAAWQTVGTGTGSGDFMKNGSVAMTGNFNAGGNKILGNTTASANLTLESTSDATKGSVLIQPNGGYVGIGTTSARAPLEVMGDQYLTHSTNDAWGSNIALRKDRAGAIVQNNDEVGYLRFDAWDGSDYKPAAAIDANVDGTPGLNDMPARLAFSTTPDGSNTLVERMRVTNAGDVGIGTISPSARLNVQNSGMASSTEYLVGRFDYSGVAHEGVALSYITNGAGTGVQYAQVRSAGGVPLALGTSSGNGQIMLLTNGNVGIGTTAPIDLLSLGAVNASATHASLNLSNTALSGASASGTYIGANPSSASADFINYQVGGTTKFRVDKNGKVTGDGSGLTGISAAPAGANTQVQFNNAGVMGASSNLIWDDTNGRLGIGTTTPADLLSVVGSSNSVGAGHIVSQNTLGFGNSWGGIVTKNDDWEETWLGTTSTGFSSYTGYPAAAGMLRSYSQNGLAIGSGYAGAGSNILFLTNGDAAANERMRITSAGNIGIGTNNPARLLHVNGAARFTPTTTPAAPAAGDLFFDSAASNALKFYDGAAWQSVGTGSGDFKKDGSVAMTGNLKLGSNYLSNDGGASEGLAFDTSGNANFTGSVGIGTATPGAPLHVNGSIKMTDGNQAAGRVMASDANGVATWTPQPYVIGGTFLGTFEDNQVLTQHPFPINVTIPAGCANSRFEFADAATASTTLSLQKCTGAGFTSCTQFGTAVISAAGKVASFTCATATSFTAGTDALLIKGPSPADTTAANAGWAIYGTR